MNWCQLEWMRNIKTNTELNLHVLHGGIMDGLGLILLPFVLGIKFIFLVS